jgi:tetratricopeptide (TPR) repeat protein
MRMRLSRTAFLLGVALLALIALTASCRRKKPDPLEQLIAAAGPERVFAGRLPGFPHRRFKPFALGENARSHSSDLLRAAALALQPGQRASPEGHRTAAIAYLLLGKWNDAVREADLALLACGQADDRSAAHARCKRADLFNTAAVVYEGRASNDRQARDYVVALEMASRAWQHTPDANAAWNRAIALDSLHLSEDAAAALRECIRLDRATGWSQEAGARLDKLTAMNEMTAQEAKRVMADVSTDDARVVEIVARYPQQAREVVQDDLLVRWAAAERTQPAQGVLLLGRCVRIGEALARNGGDHTTHEAVALLTGDDGMRQQLAIAHQRFGQARLHYRQQQTVLAAIEFRDAAAIFRHFGSPFRELCAVYEGGALFSASRFNASVAALQTSLEGGVQHRASRALGSWIAGLDYLAMGRPDEAIASYERALADFETLGERSNVAAVHDLLAEAADVVGESEVAAAHRTATLNADRGEGDPQRMSFLLDVASSRAVREGLPLSALTMSDALARAADRTGSSLWKATAHRQRAAALAALGKKSNARVEYQQARTIALTIADDDARTRMVLSVDRAGLSLLDPIEAESALDQSIAFAKATRAEIHLAGLYLERARLAEQRHDPQASEHDLLAGIGQVEAIRASMRSVESRADYSQTMRELFDRTVSLRVARNDARGALAIAERARSRVLLDSVNRDALAILYRPVPWVIADGRLTMTSLPVGRGPLTALVSRYVRGLAGPDGNQLAACLLQRIEAQIRGRRTLLLVPDGPLWAVPFSALPANGGYLIERSQIALSPSASCLAYPRRARATAGQVFVVADPAIDPQLFPRLPPLPMARDEAKTIAAVAGNVRVVVGIEATRNRLLKEAPTAAILHFACHAIENEARPYFGSLLLAADPLRHDSGVLYVREIAEMDLAHTRCVVLTACGTSRSSAIPTEGVSTIADAFIVAGVPAVVGTLWDLDDRAGPPFSREFYTQLRAGRTVIEAVRAAQLHLIRQGSAEADPRIWAAFEVIGFPET